MNQSDKKYFSYQVTQRFLKLMDRIIGNREGSKVTAMSFGEVVGISSSNINRLRSSTGENVITVEGLARMCAHYNISKDEIFWLITGKEEKKDSSIEDRLSQLEKEIKNIKASNKKTVTKVGR